MGFFKKLFSNIAKASQPLFVFDKECLKFLLDCDEYYCYEIGEYDYKTRHSAYISEAFTLNNEEFFLESVKLENSSSWKGQARSIYEGFLKDKLKIKKLEILKRENIDHYEFTTYKINDSFILHLIYICSFNSDIFIIDAKGKLFATLLKQLRENYVYEYKEDEKGEINFNISIVKMNMLECYFGNND